MPALKRFWMFLAGYFAQVHNIFAFIINNRTMHLLRMLGDILQVVVVYFIWSAAYAHSPSFGGLNREQMVTYLFVAQVFRIMISQTYEIPYANIIRNGDVIRDMIIPLVHIWKEFCFGLGFAASMGALTGLPVLLVGLLFFGVSLPPLSVLPALLLSAFLAMTISFSLSYLVGTLGFWTEGSIWGISAAKQLIAALAGGALVPLTVFPDWLRLIANLLPFQAGIYIPTTIYLGQVQGASLWATLGIQAAWAVGLLWLANLFFQYSMRKVTIQGG